jgi:hypothetical protein
MATLAAASPRKFTTSEYQDYQVVASDIIYEGSLLGLASGYARPLQAGDTYVGIAVETVDNSAGSAGDKRVRAATTVPFVMDVTGVSDVTSISLPVYASDDDTLTLTESTNSLIGIVMDYISGSSCVIQPILGSKEIYTDLST